MSITDRLQPCSYPRCYGQVFIASDAYHYKDDGTGLWVVVQEHQLAPYEDDVDEEIEEYD